MEAPLCAFHLGEQRGAVNFFGLFDEGFDAFVGMNQFGQGSAQAPS
jgi:hypothetical protein